MEHSLSKRSCLTACQRFDQTLTRGHNSEITDVKRRGGHRGVGHSGRRTFTFKGSQGRRAASHSASKQRGHSPGSSRDASLMRVTAAESGSTRTRRARLTVRTPATSRSRSTVRRTATSQQRPSSRAASAAGSLPASRKASSGGGEPNSMPPPAAPPADEAREAVGGPLSPPDFIKTEESKLVSSPPKSSDSEDAEEGESPAPDGEAGAGGDEQPQVTIEVPRSPSVVGYRKVMYDEEDHKWVEHWKVEEDAKRAKERKRREAQLARTAAKQVLAARKVKGRTTARMQVMFPTAIIRQDRRHGFVHAINMTDPLRLELHKRKAPIVPTFYQQHILKYGKLPFRNNPRPHPVV